MTVAPGLIRDSIVEYLSTVGMDASLLEINAAVAAKLGNVPPSSIRSYLNLNIPDTFARTGRGRYRLKEEKHQESNQRKPQPALRCGRAELYHADCFEWLATRDPASIHAVVTDPPYGLIEYL